MATPKTGVDARVIEVKVDKSFMDGIVRRQGTEASSGHTFNHDGAIEPPYDPRILLHIVEHSSALPPNIAAMEANIDGFGHRLEQSIRLDAAEVDDRIADFLMAKAVDEGVEDPKLPSAEAVKAEKERLALRFRLEKVMGDAFFKQCTDGGPQGGFGKLRKESRTELESTGNCYWEVCRNGKGQPARFNRLPSYTCRLTNLDPRWVKAERWVPITPVHWTRQTVERRFRRFIQRDEILAQYSYFKEFGDPRTLSPATGKFYESPEDMARFEPGVVPANEVIHFRLNSTTSQYGLPRWIGAIPEIQGVRSAAEVNYFLFKNKSVPPIVVLVSGGRLGAGATEKIENFLGELKGEQNWSKILIIEAEAKGTGGTSPTVTIERLSKEIPNDGLFQEFKKQGSYEIGAMFRMPRIFRGDVAEINRATADKSIQMTEDLVFAPERTDFDNFMNAEILPENGIFCWLFRTLTPITRDPERLADMIQKMVIAGCITPADGRRLCADVFNVHFPEIRASWMEKPITLTLAEIQNSDNGNGDVEQAAGTIIDARDRMQAKVSEESKGLVSDLRRRLQEGEPSGLSDDEVEEMLSLLDRL
jgi:PBSX family phage portal protein